MIDEPTVMEACSNALRGLFIAPPGRKLVVADLSNIEGRILPWMAGEEWKLQAFRDYDAGTGPDMYRLAYSKPFGVQPNEVTSFQRQMGKGMELSMGYEGGVGAFINIAITYKLDLDAMTASAWDLLPADVMRRAGKAWERAIEQNRTYDLRKEVFIVCDALKQMWRTAHPKIAAKCYLDVCRDTLCTHAGLWQNWQKAMQFAIQRPHTAFNVGRCSFWRTGNWLLVQKPSGKYLCYPSPRVSDDGEVSYMGVNQYNRQWARIKTYGGKGVENGDQSIAADILKHAMRRAENAGYEIVLHAHDELMSEAPDDPRFNPKHLSALFAQGETWTAGLPLAAAGFEGYRYKKE